MNRLTLITSSVTIRPSRHRHNALMCVVQILAGSPEITVRAHRPHRMTD